MKIQEGYMPFQSFQTYYRIVGEKTDKSPLLLIHGGPGSSHNYFEVFDDLAKSGRQIIMYDQLGCGLSSIPDEPDLWRQEVWLDELVALREFLNLDTLHILGQSWGGMLLIKYLCDLQPTGIKSGILSSTLSSAKLWKEEQHRLIKLMSQEDQKAIEQAELHLDFTSKEYKHAEAEFMRRHANDSLNQDTQEPLWRPGNIGKESYLHAWGPNEFFPTGTLKDFEYTSELSKICYPILITSGTDDLSTPLVSKTLFDGIPESKWTLFSQSRHMAFLEEKEEYQELLENWLKEND